MKCPDCHRHKEKFCSTCGRNNGRAEAESVYDDESVHYFHDGDLSGDELFTPMDRLDEEVPEEEKPKPVAPAAEQQEVSSPLTVEQQEVPFPLAVEQQQNESLSKQQEEEIAPVEEEEKPEIQAKRPFSIKQAPKCGVCAKSVYEAEKCLDSQERVFHSACLRCKTCKCTLMGRQRVEEPISGISVKVANGQYLVVTLDNSRLGQVGEFLCDKHSVVAVNELIKGKDVSERVRDEDELNRISLRNHPAAVAAAPSSSSRPVSIVQTPPAVVAATAYSSLPPPSPKRNIVAPIASNGNGGGNKCGGCNKAVYETERCVDSSGRVFHLTCLRCKTCKSALKGKQRVEEPEDPEANVKLTNGQYLVVLYANSRFGNAGDFLCDKHCTAAAHQAVKPQDLTEKFKDDDELNRISSLRKEQNDLSRVSLQRRAGDMLPICFRCGLPIDRGQAALTEGIRKMHAERCPTKEESAKVIRTVRHFAKSFPERLAATLVLADGQTHTFLYVVDEASLDAAFVKKPNETALVRFVPDTSARLSVNRKFALGADLDIKFRDLQEFTFENPNPQGCPASRGEWETSGVALITKFFQSNGVLQTLKARFGVVDAGGAVSSQSIEIVLEQWPKEAAIEIEQQLNPLAKLKHDIQEVPLQVDETITTQPVVAAVNKKKSVLGFGGPKKKISTSAKEARESCAVM